MRSGVTKVEVAAILVIVGVLGTLASVAVQTAREASRRQRCAENLRQIGRALASYYDVHAALPPAAVWKTNASYADPLYRSPFIAQVTRANWVALILPHWGAGDLVDTFDPNLPIGHDRHREFRTTSLAGLSCPSDSENRPDNPFVWVSPVFGEIAFARGNYAVNGGTHRFAAIPGTPADPVPNGFHYVVDRDTGRVEYWGSGVAGFNKSFTFDDFENGLSTTVAVDEVRAGIHPADSRGVWALGQIGGSVTWSHGVNGDAGHPNDPWKRADDVIGCATLHQVFGEERLVEEGMPCCSHCGYNDQATARSRHPRGVNLLMADGATRFVGDDVDPELWHVMHSRLTPAGLLATGFSKRLALGKGDYVSRWLSSSSQHNPELGESPPATFRNSIGMPFQLVPAGQFIMGLADEELNSVIQLDPPAPARRVKITRPFYLGAFEVTQQEYETVLGNNPSWHQGPADADEEAGHLPAEKSPLRERFPVEQVTWDDAAAFCRRLSERPEEQAAGRTYRLPTEAEWEYGCRAGMTTPHVFVTTRQPSDRSGENAMKEPPLPIAPVGSYAPNEFGLYDMRGNVWEWCHDWWIADDVDVYATRQDPSGPRTGYLRVVRGSDWIYTGQGCQLSFRATAPWESNRYIGFRVVCEVGRAGSAGGRR